MWSSIFLFGAIRPTNRKFTSPSSRICSSAGRADRLRDARGIDGDRKDAGRREAERLELLPVVLRIAERQIDAADQRRQLLAAERRQAEQRRIVRREVTTPA